ncbi:MAG TPA: hypothetical protein VD701_02010 [Steroidobacteraceae bacterium]|nr:hypothetical protein [Steroidobacteraceae bacterium]
MTPRQDMPLVEQRQAVRLRMQAQRELIADRLGPAPVRSEGGPRSMTMRFLTRRPGLLARLLAGLATLVVGLRYYKTLKRALALGRAVRAAAG